MTAAAQQHGLSVAGASVIEMRGITRSFGDFTANDKVDFDLHPGEIHALLGENGAGKTTLLKVLSGYLVPDEGTISIDGVGTRIPDPGTALELGIGLVHQHSVLVPQLTVAENIMLGRQPSWGSRYSLTALERDVERVCRDFGVELDPKALVENLSADRVQQAEIVRLLHREVKTIVLDEPTAILGRAYVDRLFDNLAQLRDRGHSIAIITHKMREVMAIADRVTVMRAGKVTARFTRDEFDEELLAAALIGEASTTSTSPRRRSTTTVTDDLVATHEITVTGDRGETAVSRFSLAIGGGEILGIAGVEGNGQRELVEALSGLRPIASGTVELGGRILGKLTPAALDRAGVAVISEDRLRWDVIGDFTLAENLMLPRVAERDRLVSRFGVLRRGEMTRLARDQLERFDVRPPDPAKRAGKLSGGNQQKMVLAREIDRSPSVVIAAHPARGLDIAATRFVHDKLAELRESGSAILLVSADLDELLALSDRLLVMYKGEAVYQCSAATADTQAIGRAMIGMNS